jgi:hypothetical protein
MAEIINLLADAARLDGIVREHYAKHLITGVRVVARDGQFELHLSSALPPLVYRTAEELLTQALRFGDGPIFITPPPD